jgi:sugar lactone lactonase YvrE
MFARMDFEVIQVPGHGTEDVVVGTHGSDEGAVFTGTDDGSIVRISHDRRRIDRVARTGGRPLGIEYDADGRLVVCDARRGLLRVDPASGAVETVIDSVSGRRMRFCNNAAVASDGTIWFSDSSTRFGIEQWKHDMVHDTRTGRLLRLGTDGSLDVVIDGLSFANGVALADDESYVVVAESTACTLVRLWLTGDRSGERDHLVPELVGHPDNIARGSDGLIWVTIGSPRERALRVLQRLPHAVRRAALSLPETMQPKPGRTVRVQAFDDEGTVVHDLDVPTSLHRDRFHMVTGVREHDGQVWMGSLEEPAVAVLTP